MVLDRDAFAAKQSQSCKCRIGITYTNNAESNLVLWVMLSGASAFLASLPLAAFASWISIPNMVIYLGSFSLAFPLPSAVYIPN